MRERIVKIDELDQEVGPLGQEITRCKNCKYGRHSVLAWRNTYYCRKHDFINDPEFFCSDGVREND